MTIWRGMALAIIIQRSGLLARTNCSELIAGHLDDWVTLTMRASLVQLLVVNLLLQLVDGLASYHIIAAGVPEENPVVATFITNWGVMGGLLYCKLLGCALVILIFLLRHRVAVVATQGLTILAYVYSCLGIFLMMKMLVLFA
jgi:hypothetical protein